MPSPFPGMDPFIESQDWEGFHMSIIPVFRELLIPSLRPAYICQVQKYVYLMTDEEEIRRHLAPDVNVAIDDLPFQSTDGGQVATLAPVMLALPEPLELEQPFLVIRATDGREIVTVIELLSPWNKMKTEGLAEYLTKRQEYLHSPASVMEIDLLCGGTRLPCRGPLPGGDYYCYVSRAGQRPHVGVYSWTMSDRLPVIPVPLLPEDGDVPLDLQAAFDLVYERSGYDYSLKYDKPLSPSVNDARRTW
ncbi:MAG: DUF4058 family protein, partial [Planctomycetaceae bacterium]|nr:DUF4058 family protein [Planctomycetaceae bacterium]